MDEGDIQCCLIEFPENVNLFVLMLELNVNREPYDPNCCCNTSNCMQCSPQLNQISIQAT